MMKFVPPRLRMPARMIVFGSAAVVIAVIAYGWVSVLFLVPFILAAAAGYYLWGGRDSDTAAMIRQQTDERQQNFQLKVQALIGRVMSAAAAVAYLVAVAVKATIWPFAIFVALPALSLFAGWVIYREHGGGRDSSSGVENI
jgi:hypothetical protein